MKQSDLDDLSEATSGEELLGTLSKLGEAMGFSIATIAIRVGRFGGTPTFRNLTTAPRAWVERASDRDLHRRDPVFHRLNTRADPFFYDADFYGANGGGEIWDLASPYGFRSGVSASLNLERDRLLFWGFDTDGELPKNEHVRSRLLADTLLLGVMASTVASRVLAPPTLLLSAVQRDILLHVRAGRSSWVISRLMGIGEDTVNYHLKRIRAILGVATRHLAIAKAEALGLLD